MNSFSTRVLLLLVIALALIPASANAFSNPSFSVTPSTAQSSGHPNLEVSLTRAGSQSEDIKQIVADLPPGLIANPQAVASKCAASLFNSDRCSWTQDVGSVHTTATALGILPIGIGGDVYVLNPLSTDAATLGYVLRPIGSAIGLINKVYIRNNVTVNSATDYSLRNTHLSLPTTAKAVLGLVPVAITIEDMDLNLQSRANALGTGKYFMLNQSACAPGTSKLSMTSYQNVTVTNTSNFTPTGCASVPFNPTFTQSVSNTNAEKFTGGPIAIKQNRADAAIQESTIKNVKVTFPQGTSLNFDLIDTLTGCTTTQFNANSCPAGSVIGTASAIVPALPPTFTGSVYALDPIGSTLELGVVLSGPRGIKARFRGKASVDGVGSTQRVVATVTDAPPFPLSDFTLNFTKPLLQNPDSCGSQPVTLEVEGHSGATATRTSNYTTVNCAPETTITSSPSDPTNDNTPSFSYIATPAAGGTYFECAIDSGQFSVGQCTSIGPLPDGPHLFRVRACNSINNCDQTPAERLLEYDTVPPTLTLSAPVNGSTVTSPDVSAAFDAEDGATTRCRIGGGTWVACSEPSHPFFDLPDDSTQTIEVEATDAAGNVTLRSTTFDVDYGTTSGVNTKITAGPRGGLGITDLTPTFEFESIPGGAPGFQCSIDGAAFTACASPLTIDPQEIGVHTLSVRAFDSIGDPDGTADPTPATATFDVGVFDPSVSVDYLNNTNNALPDTRAASHPDVEITLDSAYGDLDGLTFSLPDGFWGSLGAADQCTQADAAAGNCAASSRIGTGELQTADDENVLRTFTSDIHLAETPGGSIAAIVGNMHIAYDGKDYGYLRDDAQMQFSARYEREDPSRANVHDPDGMDTVATSIPSSTEAHPGPDGSTAGHLRSLKLHFDGDTGLAEGKPLLTSPSSCDENNAVGRFNDKEGNEDIETVPYQAEDCGLVPFAPQLTQTYSSVTKGTNTTATATVTIPDEHSTIRSVIIDLPRSIQPQFAGLADDCLPADTELIPPACNDATTLAGTATITTPLLPYSLTGKIYLEDSGNALPNAYVYVYDPVLDLDVRLRAATETIGTPSFIRFKLNAEPTGDPTDAPDIPFSSIALDIPGTAANGPIAKVSTACRKIDASTGTFTGWSGATAAYSQTINFDPTCPN